MPALMIIMCTVCDRGWGWGSPTWAHGTMNMEIHTLETEQGRGINAGVLLDIGGTAVP